MRSVALSRAAVALSLLLLGACAGTPPSSVVLQDDGQCPQRLQVQQTLILSLPSNPTSGYRWEIQDAATPLLRSLGPEVYSNPQKNDLIGSDGQSTWRFLVTAKGEGHLYLTYKRPWENEPSGSFECLLLVQ